MQGTPSIDKNANTKHEIRNSKQEIQYCFKHLGFYAYNVRIYLEFLFTAESQRTLRRDVFCLSEDDDKQKGSSSERIKDGFRQEFLPNRRLPIGQK